MKKFLYSITFLLACSVIFFPELKNLFKKEAPVKKELSFSIAKENSYSSQAYEKAMASVHIVISKVKYSQKTVVWDTVYTEMQLKNFPQGANALTQTILVPNIFDTKEKLIVEYMVTYNSDGCMLQLANGATITKGMMKEKFYIHI